MVDNLAIEFTNALGDTDRTRELLADGAPDVPMADGSTLLHCAAAVGNAEFAESRISRGDDVEARDALGRTPLHLAALSGDELTAVRLLEAGARVDAQDINGASPGALALDRGGAMLMLLLLCDRRDRARDLRRDIETAREAAAAKPSRSGTWFRRLFPRAH